MLQALIVIAPRARVGKDAIFLAKSLDELFRLFFDEKLRQSSVRGDVRLFGYGASLLLLLLRSATLQGGVEWVRQAALLESRRGG